MKIDCACNVLRIILPFSDKHVIPRALVQLRINCTCVLKIFQNYPRRFGIGYWLRRVKFLFRQISYHSNGIATLNPSLYKIILRGGVEMNPGYEIVDVLPCSSS